MTQSKNKNKCRSGFRWGTPVQQLDVLTSRIIATFRSQRDAFKETGIPQCGISAACSGKILSYRGYCWQFEDGLRRVKLNPLPPQIVQNSTEETGANVKQIEKATPYFLVDLSTAGLESKFMTFKQVKEFHVSLLSQFLAIAAAHSQPTEKLAHVEPVTTPQNIHMPTKTWKKLTEGNLITVLEMCANGYTNNEIAAKMGISASFASRIRNNCKGIAAYHVPVINAWHARNPMARMDSWKVKK